VFLLKLFIFLGDISRGSWPTLTEQTGGNFRRRKTKRKTRRETSPFFSFSIISQVVAFTAEDSSKEIFPPE
jgi:hypothetical protein